MIYVDMMILRNKLSKICCEYLCDRLSSSNMRIRHAGCVNQKTVERGPGWIRYVWDNAFKMVP